MDSGSAWILNLPKAARHWRTIEWEPSRKGATVQIYSYALNAWRRHGHTLCPHTASAIKGPWPTKIGRAQDNGWDWLAGEKYLLLPCGNRGLLLGRGITPMLGDGTNFARLAAIKGLFERLPGGQVTRIGGEHLSPGNNLHSIPNCAIGTKPGKTEAGDGGVASHELVTAKLGCAGQIQNVRTNPTPRHLVFVVTSNRKRFLEFLAKYNKSPCYTSNMA